LEKQLRPIWDAFIFMRSMVRDGAITPDIYRFYFWHTGTRSQSIKKWIVKWCMFLDSELTRFNNEQRKERQKQIDQQRPQ
jgi:hypothetical protein